MADPADRSLPPPPPPIDDAVVPEGADSEHQTGILDADLGFLDDPAVNPEKMPFDDNGDPSDNAVVPAVSAAPGVNRKLGTQFERTVTRQCAKTHFDPNLDEVDPPETPELVSEPTPLLVRGSTLLRGRARGDDVGGEKVVRVRAETALRASSVSRSLLDANKGVSCDQRDVA